MTLAEKLSALRRQMTEAGLAAYVIPSTDPHQSEYVADRFKAREWISGFAGSAGTVVVTAEEAGLWTDARYYLEAEEVLAGTEIRLFRADEPDVPDYPAWLGSHLSGDSVVGVWGDSVSLAAFRSLRDTLRGSGLTLRETEDLLDPIWPDRPALPTGKAFLMEQEYAGRSRTEKLAELRSTLLRTGLDGYLIPALDEVAWLFNLRGADIPYNPLALAYAVVTQSQALLFMDPEKLTEEDRTRLDGDGVQVQPYGDICRSLGTLRGEAGARANAAADSPEAGSPSIAGDPGAVTAALSHCLPEGAPLIEQSSPLALAKARKNRSEIEGTRRAMRKDAVAMERFLYWLEQAVPTGRVTELKATEVLRAFRAEQEEFVGESFPTISGYEGHGAIVHYRVTEETDTPLAPRGIYLVDSGGQYAHGTTDITRVVPLGEPSRQMKSDYTLVLKGHIALSTLRFPRGTRGDQIDVLARTELWRRGLNYGHGTGHGVGCFLNVHEGPQRISTRASGVALEPGMIVSNEPGLYRAGEYGIRIENLVVVQEDITTEFASFYRFETLTMCHIDTRLIDPTLLTEEERRWVDRYNSWIYEEIAPELEHPVRAWLAEQTRPI